MPQNQQIGWGRWFTSDDQPDDVSSQSEATLQIWECTNQPSPHPSEVHLTPSDSFADSEQRAPKPVPLLNQVLPSAATRKSKITVDWFAPRYMRLRDDLTRFTAGRQNSYLRLKLNETLTRGSHQSATMTIYQNGGSVKWAVSLCSALCQLSSLLTPLHDTQSVWG